MFNEVCIHDTPVLYFLPGLTVLQYVVYDPEQVKIRYVVMMDIANKKPEIMDIDDPEKE
jgi:hypothetical protein